MTKKNSDGKFELKPFQKEAIQALSDSARPAHVICVAPTGSGKSLIYEEISRLSGTRTVLITPLVALARQQEAKLLSVGVEVFFGAGPQAPLRKKKSGVWIISPESLKFAFRHRELKTFQPNFLTVDECHCLWDWGDGFRPAFQLVPDLLRSYPIQRSLWLTATLPSEARDRLRRDLPDPVIEIGQFSLPSTLFLDVRNVSWIDRTEAMIRFVQKQRECGIIFVNTRDSTARLARIFEAVGITHLIYHAGISAEERRASESLIALGKVKVVIATSAFGMGMDHPHLSWVVLWQAPPSLLSLTQTIGRVGRGKKGHALLFWDRDDFRMLEWTTKGLARRKAELLSTLRFLSSPGCRELNLRKYFDPKLADDSYRCGRCDYCEAAGV